MTSGVLPDPLRRRTTVEEALAAAEQEPFRLRREVDALDLVVFGIGVIIGAGIFVLTGVAAAAEGGAGITRSFVLGAFVALLAGVMPIELVAELVDIGTPFAFALVATGIRRPGITSTCSTAARAARSATGCGGYLE